MRTTTHTSRNLEAWSIAGLFAGIAGLLAACLAPDLEAMAVPALLVLVPSLLLGTR